MPKCVVNVSRRCDWNGCWLQPRRAVDHLGTRSASRPRSRWGQGSRRAALGVSEQREAEVTLGISTTRMESGGVASLVGLVKQHEEKQFEVTASGSSRLEINRTFSPLDATRSYKLGLIKGGRGFFARSSTKTDQVGPFSQTVLSDRAIDPLCPTSYILIRVSLCGKLFR